MASLLDTYLGSSNKPSSEKEDVGTSLFDTYLAVSPTPKSQPVPEAQRVVAPPISGLPPEESDKRNIEIAKTPVNQPQESRVAKAIAGLPVELGSNIAQSYQGSVDYVTQGLKETTSNQPLGIGKVALGTLGAIVSPITGATKTFIEEPVTQLTGNKTIGEKAGIVATSGLPVARATKSVVQAMPSNKAINAIVDTIGTDNLAATISELKRNPRLSIMDVVPATKQMAQKLITTPGGEHQNKFTKWVEDRIGTAKGAVADIYDTAMGTPVNIVEKINELKTSAKSVGTKDIEPAVKGAGPVDVSGVIANIDAKLKPGVNSVISAGQPLPLGDIEKPLSVIRKYLTDEKSIRTDAQSLHQFQSALRAKADDLSNSSNAVERQQGYALMNVRNDIVNAIDAASPKIKLADGTEVGSYKQGLSKYRDEKQVENAFQMGQLVTRNKLGRLEDSPEFWDQWVKTASKEELAAAREGARLAVQHQIGGFKAGARKGTDIIESEFNREKLSSLFSKKEIDEMATRLKDERDIALTNQHLIHNSQTAMRQKADARVDLPVEGKSGTGALAIPTAVGEMVLMQSGGPSGLAAGAALASVLGKKAKFKVDTKLAERRNENITNLLTATGEDREKLIKILESRLPQPKPSLLTRAQNLALPVLPP